jgi:hypothetical protein
MSTQEAVGLQRAASQELVVPSYVTAAREMSNISLRELTTAVLLVVFSGSVAATYTLIFFWGFQKIKLPNGFVHWLGAATVGQTASLLVLIVKNLFPAGSRRSSIRKKSGTA